MRKLNEINWCEELNGIAWYYETEYIETFDNIKSIDDINKKLSKKIQGVFLEKYVFFKKYEDRPSELQKDCPETYKIYENVHITDWGIDPLSVKEPILLFLRFNAWLFDYCFSDIQEV